MVSMEQGCNESGKMTVVSSLNHVVYLMMPIAERPSVNAEGETITVNRECETSQYSFDQLLLQAFGQEQNSFSFGKEYS